MATPLPRGLYALTPGARPDLIDVASDILAGGARVLQYRDDGADMSRRLAEAQQLRQLCQDTGALLLVDQDLPLALAVSADGVHLSQESADIGAARAQLGPDALIGVSCFASLERARWAVAQGADYISFGAFFPSPTLPHAGRAPMALLHESAALGVPRVAIGGITPDNAPALISAGAHAVAAISALFDAPAPRAVAQRFSHLFA